MKNNKKFTLIAVLFVLFTSAIVNAQELNCKDLGVEGLCIDIEFISMKEDYKTPSEYEFPDLAKTNDYLIIRKITAINKPGIFAESENLSNVTLKIDMYPIRREDIQQFESSGYSTIKIPPLKVNDVYELTYQDEWGKYEARLNGQVINEGQYLIYPKKLYTDGDWKIDEKIKEKIDERIERDVGNSIINNGDRKNNFFKVYSNLEMTNLKTAESNLEIARYSLVSSWINIGVVLLIAIVSMIAGYLSTSVQRRIARKQGENLKEVTQELKNLVQNITTSTEKQIKGSKEEEEGKRRITMSQKNDDLDIENDYVDIVRRYRDVVEKDDLRELYKQNVGKTTKILITVYSAVILIAIYIDFSKIGLLPSVVIAIGIMVLLILVPIVLIYIWNPKEEFEKYLTAVKELNKLKELERED